MSVLLSETPRVTAEVVLTINILLSALSGRPSIVVQRYTTKTATPMQRQQSQVFAG
jgi:hypothetical protein